ncbi:MAG: hypothetical protein K8S56_04145, partial [Candidatus Cloacimonetes bacterium]|nr:hypothetical protein [Candidatus Cloacimonadota bacterium]
MFTNQSIKFKVTTSIIVLVSLLLVIFGVSFAVYFSSQMTEKLTSSLKSKGEEIGGIMAKAAVDHLYNYNYDALANQAESIGINKEIIYAYFQDKSGNSVAQYHDTDYYAIKEISASNSDISISDLANKLKDKYSVLEINLEISDENGSYGNLTIGLTQDIIREDLKKTQRSIGLIAAIFILASSVILLFIIMALMKSFLTKPIDSIKTQVSDLVIDIVNGNLDTRGNPDDTVVDFREMIEQTNELIEAFIKPINFASDNLERIAYGDIPEQITEIYNGDFNRIKESLNRVSSSINLLISDAEEMVN